MFTEDNLFSMGLGNSKRIAKFKGFRFKLIKWESNRMFIKRTCDKQPIWINEDQIKYSFESRYSI